MADTKKLSNTELTLAEKLSRIQYELKVPKDKYNSYGGYSYRSAEGILEALKPLLKTYGVYVTISDEIVEIGGRIYVQANVDLHDLNGSIISTHASAREAETKKGMDDAQVTGATSSYARKYALNGLFLLDDTKDADTDEYAIQTKAEPKKATPAPKATATLICERCNKPITSIGKHSPSDVAQQTRTKFGKQLCYECGKAVKQAQEAPTEEFAFENGLPFPIED